MLGMVHVGAGGCGELDDVSKRERERERVKDVIRYLVGRHRAEFCLST